MADGAAAPKKPKAWELNESDEDEDADEEECADEGEDSGMGDAGQTAGGELVLKEAAMKGGVVAVRTNSSSQAKAKEVSHGNVKFCAMCKGCSDKERWFLEKNITKGARVRIPLESLCYLCGVACEAWPLDCAGRHGKAILIERHQKHEAFREAFDKVRLGASTMQFATFRAQEPRTIEATGVEVELHAAFVEESAFKTHFGQPPESVRGVVKVALPLPGSSRDMQGAVLSLQGLPSDLPHYRIRLLTRIEHQLNEALLRADELLRDGQAHERWQLACQANPLVQPTHMLDALSGEQVAGRIQQDQDSKVAEEEERMASDLGAQLGDSLVSGSRLGFGRDAGVGAAEAAAPPRKRLKKGSAPAGATTPTASASSGSKRKPTPSPTAVAPGGLLAMDPGAAGSAAPQAAKGRRAPLGVAGISVLGILTGTMLGRSTRPLKNKIKNQSFNSDSEQREAEELVAAAEAAEALQIPKLAKLGWTELVKHANFLAIYGVDLPNTHKQFITMKYGAMMLQQRRFDEWLKTLDAEDTGDGEWDILAPKFGKCWDTWNEAADDGEGDAAERGGDQDRDEDTKDKEKEKAEKELGPQVPADLTNQGVLWLRTIADEYLLTLVGHPENKDSIIEMCDHFMRMWAVDHGKWPEGLQKYSTMAANLCRGLLALASPVPMHYGASLEHVDYIHTTGSKAPALADDVPRMGRLIASRVKKDWNDAAKEFRQHIGALVTMGPRFREVLLASEERMRAGEDVDIAEKLEGLYQSVRQDLASWQESLRLGATVRLEKNIAALVQTDLQVVANAVEVGEMDCASGLGLLSDMSGNLAVLSQEHSAGVIAEIGKYEMKWKAEAASGTLSKSIDTFTGGPSTETLSALAQALAVVGGSSPIEVPKLQDTGQALLTWATGPGDLSATSFTDIGTVLGKAALPQGSSFREVSVLIGEAQSACAVGQIAQKPDIAFKAILAAQRCLDSLKSNGQEKMLKFCEKATQVMESLVDSFQTAHETAIMASAQVVAENSTKLGQIAGGAANGAKWHADFNGAQKAKKKQPAAPTILEHFQKTLGTVNTDQIEQYKASTLAVVEQCEMLRVSYREVFGGRELKTPGVNEILSSAKSHLRTAAVTFCEYMCCLALLRPKPKKDNLDRFTCQLAVEITDEWKTHVCAPLVALILKVQ